MHESAETGLPLSAAQQGIWVGQQLDVRSPIYNAGECIEIRGPLDTEHFEVAIQQALGEAEALHARFSVLSGESRQHLLPRATIALRRVDLRGATDAWATARDWMHRDLGQTVDLGEGPLFGTALLQAAPERFFWFLRVHHIALDGFGFSLLTRRVADLYTARMTGRAAPGGFGSLQAVLDEDVAYQRSAQREADRAFWMERFADGLTPVTLAAPAPMSATFVRRTHHLSTSEVERLQSLARREGLSWPDLLLSTTAAWLHRETSSTEVVLGLPVMSRLGSAALRVPCMAMNIVPLRVKARPEAGLLDIARGVAHEVRSARPHLRYRYEQLRRDLRRVGGPRRLFGPVVNIMPFDYGVRFAGIPSIAHNVSAGPVEDLSIGVYARSDGGGLRVDFDANPACYREERLAAHQQEFIQLLEDLVTAPERPIARASTGSVSPSLLDGGPLPVAPRAVLACITEQARLRPQAIAVEHGPYSLTYEALLTAATDVAARLVDAGVRPDTPVAVMVPRSLDAITAVLGVLLSGAGYLPIDPYGPVTRTAAILADADPELILSLVETRLGQGAGPLPVGGLVLRRREMEQARQPSPREADDRLAYVIYTSGSTGQPNGVEVTQGALAHFVAGATHRYGLSAEDRVLQFAPLHFDASVEELFLTLCTGARLVLRTDAMLQSVPRLLESCAERDITVLDLPTAFWHELAYAVSTGAVALPPSLRTVIIGGEAALPERVARWRDTVPPSVQLLNTYGPTEATVVATSARLGAPGAEAADPGIPIGLPLPGVRAALVDAHGAVVPRGDEGELYLMGDGLARGYLGRDALTAARFVPITSLPDAPRAYRTGDRARMRGDGQLVFVGRVDDEFKISGHRIAPAEVESVLLTHPAVQAVAVVGQVLPSGARRLCAQVVAQAPVPTTAALREHVRARLPAPMVPGALVFVESLPRTSTGKIDRAALLRAFPAEDPGFTEETTVMERRVLEVWEQVLGVRGASPRDDFFDLGGQSLQSIQVANRLSIMLGREVPVATVFRHPTAAALALALEHGEAEVPRAEGLPASLLADAALPEDVVPPRLTATSGPPRCILLTGASGFVGAHLLDQLLRRTDARVICPVRARDASHAMKRLQAALTSQRLAPRGLNERVVALPADLTQPHLGLERSRYDALAQECDAILHNAAVVSVVREYSSLQAANVRGTRELLRLAVTGRAKPFHHVSTLAVAPQRDLHPEVPEAFVPAHAGLRDGYQQSKWAAERLVEQASERGLPVNVYRLGRVVGAPDTALVNPQDLVWRILLAGIPVGALPRLDMGETWTPVDYVAKAVVQLVREPRPGTVFNLAPVPEVRLPELFTWVREFGYPIELCSAPEWSARVAQHSRSPEHDSTLAFFDLRSGDARPVFGLGAIRAERIIEALADTDITCPAADRALLHRYLDTCVAQGLLPPPARPWDLSPSRSAPRSETTPT
ncbi:myxochelin non-ribosomal peptide synthetase MxcG [Myxococcaceae bacterium JPH2]|nr:myxochelin non-ribosomal peptide synthetase MxcG [Myxococcaceae bacterium JPH2]